MKGLKWSTAKENLIHDVQLRNVGDTGEPLPKKCMTDNDLIQRIRNNRSVMDSVNIEYKIGTLTIDLAAFHTQDRANVGTDEFAPKGITVLPSVVIRSHSFFFKFRSCPSQGSWDIIIPPFLYQRI